MPPYSKPARVALDSALDCNYAHPQPWRQLAPFHCLTCWIIRPRASLRLESQTDARSLHVSGVCACLMTAQPADLPACTLGWLMTDECSQRGPSFCWPPRHDCMHGWRRNWGPQVCFWSSGGAGGPSVVKQSTCPPINRTAWFGYLYRYHGALARCGRKVWRMHVCWPLLVSHLTVLPAGQALLTMEHQAAPYRTSCIQ